MKLQKSKAEIPLAELRFLVDEGCCASSLVCCPRPMQGIPVTAVAPAQWPLIVSRQFLAAKAATEATGSWHWLKWTWRDFWNDPGNHEEESPLEEWSILFKSKDSLHFIRLTARNLSGECLLTSEMPSEHSWIRFVIKICRLKMY